MDVNLFKHPWNEETSFYIPQIVIKDKYGFRFTAIHNGLATIWFDGYKPKELTGKSQDISLVKENCTKEEIAQIYKIFSHSIEKFSELKKMGFVKEKEVA